MRFQAEDTCSFLKETEKKVDTATFGKLINTTGDWKIGMNYTLTIFAGPNPNKNRTRLQVRSWSSVKVKRNQRKGLAEEVVEFLDSSSSSSSSSQDNKHSPYFVFLQSSGMGKTKLLYECRKQYRSSESTDVKMVLCQEKRKEAEGEVFDCFLNLVNRRNESFKTNMEEVGKKSWRTWSQI